MAPLGLNSKDRELTADRIGELFAAVDSRLDGSEPLDILVVGGAAISLQWNPARITYDVDVVSEGVTQDFRNAVAAVGRREGLDAHWLNDAAKAKTPSGSGTRVSEPPLLRVEPTGVRGRRPLRAGHEAGLGTPHRHPGHAGADGRRPPSDQRRLFDLVEQAYPHIQIPVSTRYIIDMVWADYAADHPEL